MSSSFLLLIDSLRVSWKTTSLEILSSRRLTPAASCQLSADRWTQACLETLENSKKLRQLAFKELTIPEILLFSMSRAQQNTANLLLSHLMLSQLNRPLYYAI